MGRVLNNASGDRIAEWDQNGDLVVDADTIFKVYVPTFIKWLQAGPPKPQYRITKVFDHRPTGTWVHNSLGCYLTDADIEEIPCSG